MNQKIVAIAYCIDNLKLVEEITQSLANTKYRFEHFYGKKNTSSPSIFEQTQQQVNPILLIITDNFLKCAQCMNDSLDLIQNKKDQILPIIAPGIHKDAQTEEMVETATNFERVSDIIQYINYWQDQYLDLRRQKRLVTFEEEEAKLNSDLKVMREISSEAGEFLRLLRNMDYVSFDEFVSSDFKDLFEFTHDTDEWYNYKQNKSLNVVPSGSAEPTVEETDGSFEIGNIPGIELLEGKENITKILEKKKEQDLNQKEKVDNLPPTIEIPEETEEKATEEDNQFHPSASMGENEVLKEEEEEEPVALDINLETTHSGKEEEEEDQVSANVESDNTIEENEKITAGLPVNEEEEEEEENSKLVLFEIEEEEEEEEEEDDDEEDDDDDDEEDDDDEDDELDAGPNNEESIRVILTQAMYMIDQGQFKESVALLERSINDYPESNKLRYRYALLLAQDGIDLEGAISQLNIILSKEPNNDDANFLMGELSEMNGRYGDARRYYERVATSNADYLDVYYRLGYVLANHFEQEYGQAAKYFKKAAKKNPSNVDAFYQYALLLNEKLDRPYKAIKYFKKALSEQSSHPFANYDLALLYHRMGNRSAAWEAYQKAIAINPELKTPENDLVFSYRDTVPNSASPLAQTLNETEETERDTIAALKDNIQRLEELLHSRAAEKPKKAKQPEVDIKTIFISGATAGIGKATAIVFAEHGHRLIINGRRLDRLEAFKKELEEQYHINVYICPFDVREVESIEEAIEYMPEDWKSIDILINNAGKAKGFDPIHEGKLEHWEEMIDTNLKGLLYLTRAIAPLMTERKSGHIINVSSSAGKEVYPMGNVYCATKHAVEALTKAMRIDLHKYNIRVSQVAPGHVEETEFALVRFDGDAEKAKIYEDFNPLTSRDVAETIYFIASRPPHVNVQDVLLFGTQQASATMIDKSGRK